MGRGRVEVICAGQDSACFKHYLEALDARHSATGKEVCLALDNGPCHTSTASQDFTYRLKEHIHGTA